VPKARPFLISDPYLEVNAVWVLRMLLLLIVVVVLTGFAMVNSGERATITLGTAALTFSNVPLVLLLFEAFVLGAIVWFFVSIGHEISLRRIIRRQKREIADLNQETAGLRHISLDEIDEEESVD
jgi:uncharacterized integral membrane protein